MALSDTKKKLIDKIGSSSNSQEQKNRLLKALMMDSSEQEQKDAQRYTQTEKSGFALNAIKGNDSIYQFPTNNRIQYKFISGRSKGKTFECIPPILKFKLISLKKDSMILEALQVKEKLSKEAKKIVKEGQISIQFKSANVSLNNNIEELIIL